MIVPANRNTGAYRVAGIAGAAVIMSLSVWTMGYGRGVAIASITIPLLIWSIVWIEREMSVKPIRTSAANPLPPIPRVWLRAAVALLLCPSAAIGVGALYLATGPGNTATRVVVAGLIALILWAIMSLWSFASERLGLLCGILIIITLCSGTLAWAVR